MIEGETSFHLSVQSGCIRYKWCRDQDDSLGGLSVRYRISGILPIITNIHNAFHVYNAIRRNDHTHTQYLMFQK